MWFPDLPLRAAPLPTREFLFDHVVHSLTLITAPFGRVQAHHRTTSSMRATPAESLTIRWIRLFADHPARCWLALTLVLAALTDSDLFVPAGDPLEPRSFITRTSTTRLTFEAKAATGLGAAVKGPRDEPARRREQAGQLQSQEEQEVGSPRARAVILKEGYAPREASGGRHDCDADFTGHAH